MQHKAYVLDTNVLIHDPNSLLAFEDNHIIIPMTVLEELDKLKSGKQAVASDCRAAIRMIDELLGDAPPEAIQKGIPIKRGLDDEPCGIISVLMHEVLPKGEDYLLNDINDNKIINSLTKYQKAHKDEKVILISKDINMRLKARTCGIESEDYNSDHMVKNVDQLPTGYIRVSGSFWDRVENVESRQVGSRAFHVVARDHFEDELYPNQFILDEKGFAGRVQEVHDDKVTLLDMNQDYLMHQTAWGLKPHNIEQAMALNLLLDRDVHLVNLTGPAGSGKTIVALAAAIEMTVEKNLYDKIIATRSTPSLAEEHGFLPGTEEEKMDPWLGAINDNIEALHARDDQPNSSIEYVKEKANIQFKAMNYIRGRSFQKALILIDESQNLTPFQMKTIITRAGEGSKVICLGNLAQIDTPYLSPSSSGLTYMTQRFKGFTHGGNIALSGVPRSRLAEYAEKHL